MAAPDAKVVDGDRNSMRTPHEIILNFEGPARIYITILTEVLIFSSKQTGMQDLDLCSRSQGTSRLGEYFANKTTSVKTGISHTYVSVCALEGC